MNIETMCLQNECEGELGKQSAAVVFLSVPHHGCPLATIANSAILSFLLRPTPELNEMRTGEIFCMKRYLYLIVTVLDQLKEDPINMHNCH